MREDLFTKMEDRYRLFADAEVQAAPAAGEELTGAAARPSRPLENCGWASTPETGVEIEEFISEPSEGAPLHSASRQGRRAGRPHMGMGRR